METPNRARRGSQPSGWRPVEGMLIEEKRKERKLSQQDVAPLVGVSRQRWGMLERGRRTSGRVRATGSPDTYARMAIAVGLTPDDVMREATLVTYTTSERRRLLQLAAAMGRHRVPGPAAEPKRPSPLNVGQVADFLTSLRSMCDEATLQTALQNLGIIPFDERQTNAS